MKNYILGIDQGSTGSKVLVVDVKGEVVCSAYRGIDSFCPHEGWVEHDPDAVWQSVREAILEVAEQTCAKSAPSVLPTSVKRPFYGSAPPARR